MLNAPSSGDADWLEDDIRWPVWLLCVAVVLAAVAGAWGRVPFVRSPREVILDAARQVHGDILVLSYDSPAPDLEAVLDLTTRTPGVAQASVLAVWEVRLESATASAAAVLELQSLYSAQRRPRGTPLPPTEARSPEISVGRLLADTLGISPGDSVVVHVAPGAATTAAARTRCKVVSVVDWGLDYFDERVVIADISHLSDFSLMPIGVSLQLSAPDLREGFAADLQRQLSPRWRVIPLEQVIEPLLRPHSGVARKESQHAGRDAAPTRRLLPL